MSTDDAMWVLFGLGAVLTLLIAVLAVGRRRRWPKGTDKVQVVVLAWIPDQHAGHSHHCPPDHSHHDSHHSNLFDD